MKRKIALCCAFLFTPVAVSAFDNSTTAASELPHSSVSLLVEPRLNDGRLVLKLAAQNKTKDPVPFGPASVSITKPDGAPIALRSLPQLTDDIRAAAGMKLEAAPPKAPLAQAYAAPQMQVNAAGQPDVSNFTGGSVAGRDELFRESNTASRRSKPTIDEATAETQIAALKQAILQDTAVQPGQVAAGELVSERLNFKRGEGRVINVRVRIAGDEHGFTIAAPTS